MKIRGMFLLVLVLPLLLFGETDAMTTTVSYQGTLADASGNPLPDGDYAVMFKIWSDSAGGSPLWSESQTLSVSNSFFDVYLGANTPLSEDVFAVGGGTPDPGARYLEITVGTEILSPRTRLAAVPYTSVARRMSGDVFTGEGRLVIRDLMGPGHLPAVDIAADSAGSSLRMIGGGNPDPSDLPTAELLAGMGQSSLSMVGGGAPDPSTAPRAELMADMSQTSLSMIGGGSPDPSDLPRIDLSADSNHSSFFAIGGGTPDPGQSPSIGLSADVNQSSFFIGGGNPDPSNATRTELLADINHTSLSMIGGGTPDPSNSPRMELTADNLLQRTSLSMIGGGSPDPGEVSLELRLAADDSASIRMYATETSMGIDLRNTNDQLSARLSGDGLGLFTDAGSSMAAPIGTRFRDNAVVAWGNVQAAGSLASDFGVLSVAHPSSGQYTITLNNSASDLDNLIPTAIAEVSAIPVTATAARLITVNQLTSNSFAVYITTGGYTPIDNNFVFMVTAR